MPRQMRLEYPGAIYHVLSRGNQREPTFLDEGDQHDFRKTLAEARAEGIIAEELKRLRWQAAVLNRRAKSDPGKLAMAARLRRETTMTIQEIADRLQMGSRKSIAPKLHAWSKANE